MKVAVAGSVGLDHLMTFPGKFTDSFVEGSLSSISLSFLVDDLDVRRGGTGANIAFGMGALGLHPLLISAVGKDWAEYNTWLTEHGVDTKHCKISTKAHTATFVVTTDSALNQIASFYPGAMSEAREINLEEIIKKEGDIDLIVISPDDPEAMVKHSQTALKLKIAFAADPSQQLARMDGEDIKKLVTGAKYLFLNEYELALILQKTGWSDAELFDQVQVRVVTLGSKGAIVEEHGQPNISVGVPTEKVKLDPTGVGDSFRSGFLAGLSWGLNHERCAQIGSMVATFCIETKGTQEYVFDKKTFMSRFEEAYGAQAANDVSEFINPVMG